MLIARVRRHLSGNGVGTAAVTLLGNRKLWNLLTSGIIDTE